MAPKTWRDNMKATAASEEVQETPTRNFCKTTFCCDQVFWYRFSFSERLLSVGLAPPGLLVLWSPGPLVPWSPDPWSLPK